MATAITERLRSYACNVECRLLIRSRKKLGYIICASKWKDNAWKDKMVLACFGRKVCSLILC